MNAWRLFEVVGIELEYALVDSALGDIRAVAEAVLRDDDGVVHNEVAATEGALFSNELAAHVIELKGDGPVPRPSALLAPMMRSLRSVASRLESSKVLPVGVGMHPLMRPESMQLWPHDDHVVYATFDRIFGCQGHGWSNLQSMHINLPFSGDDEFRRLHSAIRLLLPALPALGASSPFLEGQHRGYLDQRLEVYRHNADRVPAVAGRVIPDVMHSESDYHERIYAPIARSLRDLDPHQVLDPVWVNSRGAIARFDRGAVEIRVMDVQEWPGADLARAELIVAVLRDLVEETHCSLASQEAVSTETLVALFDEAVRVGGRRRVSEVYGALFGFSEPKTLHGFWSDLVERAAGAGRVDEALLPSLQLFQREGTLASRMLRAVGKRPTELALVSLLQRLGQCGQLGCDFHVED